MKKTVVILIKREKIGHQESIELIKHIILKTVVRTA